MTDTPDSALALNSSTSSGLSGAQIVQEMQKYIGDEYVFGAAGPTTFDCSGLVQYGLEQLGMQNVPRTSEAQYTWTSHVSGPPVAGELVFENFPGEASPGHVGIAINATQMIDAPFTGAKVRVDPIDTAALVGYGVVPTSTVSASDDSSISTDSILSNPLSPSSWINAIKGALNSLLPGGFETDVEHLGERIGFIFFGFVLVIFGIVIFAKNGTKHLPSVMPQSTKGDSSESDDNGQSGTDNDSDSSTTVLSPEKEEVKQPPAKQTAPAAETSAVRSVGIDDAIEAAAIA
jgi:cell wall-associated NlpC family hydrolase